MEKRYQVFISSTFKDLEEERKEVMEAILSLDCFPAGMEMFPAVDMDQFEYIKTIIDKSDYYVLVIAGKYGSLADDGISFTEKEYDYAKKKGIPVSVLVKKDIDHIDASKIELNPKLRKKLDKFRDKAMKNKLADFWDNSSDLKYAVHTSLSKAFKVHPRTGWVKSNEIITAEKVEELESLKVVNAKLKAEISLWQKDFQTKERDKIKDIAYGDDETKLKYKNRNGDYGYIDFKWNEIFYIFGKLIHRNDSATDEQMKRELQKVIANRVNKYDFDIMISEDEIIRLEVQLTQLNLIKKVSGKSEFVFTEYGEREFNNKLIEKKEN